MILIGQNNQGEELFADKPMMLVAGSATQAAKDPFIAKTRSISTISKFELIPHLFFNCSITEFKTRQKYTFYWPEHNKIEKLPLLNNYLIRESFVNWHGACTSGY